MNTPIIESASQVAARLGVTTRTINRRIKKGTMAGIKHPSPGKNGFINLVVSPTEPDKSDAYAIATHLAERLERQIAINEALRVELTELAARPCLACAVLPNNTEQLESALQHALLLLDGVDKSELQLTPRWSEWTSFLRERAQLWEIYNRLTSAQKGA